MKYSWLLLYTITSASLAYGQYGFPLGDFANGLPSSQLSQDFQPTEPCKDQSGASWTFFLLNNVYNCNGAGKGYRGHTGEDWAVNYATDVFAIGPGQVVFAKDLGGDWKKVVIIKHVLQGNSIVYSQYAHLSSISVALTDPPITNPRAAPIGKSGTAGSGPHLHWEVKQFPSPNAIGAGPGYTQQHSTPNSGSVMFNSVTYLRPSAFVKAQQAIPATGTIAVNATLDNATTALTPFTLTDPNNNPVSPAQLGKPLPVGTYRSPVPAILRTVLSAAFFPAGS